jgi:hypothetical protein
MWRRLRAAWENCWISAENQDSKNNCFNFGRFSVKTSADLCSSCLFLVLVVGGIRHRKDAIMQPVHAGRFISILLCSRNKFTYGVSNKTHSIFENFMFDKLHDISRKQVDFGVLFARFRHTNLCCKTNSNNGLSGGHHSENKLLLY